jgi:hypothetical protein
VKMTLTGGGLMGDVGGSAEIRYSFKVQAQEYWALWAISPSLPEVTPVPVAQMAT